MARERSALVGRDADARVLRELVQGDATLVLLSGDAGVGKSRLLAELLAGVGDRLVGSCLPLRNRITLLPFQEMFSAGAVRKRVTRAAASLPPGLAQGLAPLLPEEMISSRGSTAPAQPEIERSFAGVRALLAAMAEDGPLVVAVEDVHWADVASLDLLTYLPGQLRDTEVTVVATLRTDDPDGRTPEMLEWLAQVQHAEGAEQLALERLDRDGTEALMATLLGGRAPAAIVDSVHRRAEGNPFFTEQLVAAMTRSDDLTSTRLPQRLADFLSSRVRTASTEGVQLLEALAVAARPLRIGALVDVAGLDEHVVRRTLRTLVETALVEVGPDQEVRTRHALLNEAVLREVPTTDRATLHRRLAQALTVEHGDALAAEIAGHWREAGEPVQELVWAEKAANAALAVGAYAEASVLLQRVLDLTDEVDGAATITEASPVELWCRAVRTVDFAGDRRRSDQMAEEAFDRFQDWPDPVELARLQHIRAHQRILNDVPGGVELLQQVVSELERLPVTTEYVEALLLLASTLVWHGDSEGALPLLERAVSLTDDSSPAFLRTRALCRLAQALDALGETARGAQALEEAAAVAQATGDPMAVVSVAVDRSDRLLTAGRLEEARAVALEGLDFAREQGQASSWTPHILVYNATEAALQQGLTETAAELVTELTDHPLRADVDILQELRADVELRQGLVAEGLARIEGLTVVLVAVDEQADSGARVVWLSRWAGRPEPAWSAALDLAERISGTDADFQLSLHAAVAGAVADVAVAARARRDPGRARDHDRGGRPAAGLVRAVRGWGPASRGEAR